MAVSLVYNFISRVKVQMSGIICHILFKVRIDIQLALKTYMKTMTSTEQQNSSFFCGIVLLETKVDWNHWSTIMLKQKICVMYACFNMLKNAIETDKKPFFCMPWVKASIVEVDLIRVNKNITLKAYNLPLHRFLLCIYREKQEPECLLGSQSLWLIPA